MNGFWRLLAAFFLSLTLASSVVLAQDVTTVLTNVITAFLGQLPPACYNDFGSQLCLECMTIGKILPLALLTSLFFFAFYYVMRYISTVTTHTQQGPVTGPGQPTATELRIAAAVGIVIGLLFLHTSAIQNALQQTVFWMQIGFIVLIIMFVASTIRSTKGGWLWVIFAFIVLIFLVPLIWSQFGQITNYFTANCIS